MGDRGHNTHGPKRGGAGLLCPFRGELGPHLAQCGLGRGLLLYQLTSSFIQSFRHNKHRPKNGWGLCHCFWRSWVPIEHKVAWAEAYLHAKWHLSPSSRLATTDIGRKLGLCPFRGGRAGSPSNTMSSGPRSTSLTSSIQPFGH